MRCDVKIDELISGATNHSILFSSSFTVRVTCTGGAFAQSTRTVIVRSSVYCQ
jgi:hypothetical protein